MLGAPLYDGNNFAYLNPCLTATMNSVLLHYRFLNGLGRDDPVYDNAVYVPFFAKTIIKEVIVLLII